MPASWANCMVTQPLWRITSRSFLLILCSGYVDGSVFLICHFVIIHGVRGGIERASKVMMPLLFILLLIIVVAACLLPDAGKGGGVLLKPDFGKVDRNVFPECPATVSRSIL